MLETRPAPAMADRRAPLAHGGDLAVARALFPDAPEPWIDLSTGVNPRPYRIDALPGDCFARLPEPRAQRTLEAAAARAYGAPEPATVVAAPGAQALIQLLPRLWRGPRVGVLGPTYEEHAASWRRAGCDVAACASLDEMAACDIGVLVNPNNPTGRVVSRDQLLHCARRTRLVVDESFADLCAEASLAAKAAATGAIVLRSFGKTYGLAGLRLGFAVAPPDIAERLRAELGPWPLSGPAIAIGTRALCDAEWLSNARAHALAGAARLDALLTGAGFRIVGGTPLFRLAAHDDAQGVADRLGRAGVHVRRFAIDATWLRLGLPPDWAWPRVAAALGGAEAAS